MCGLVGIYSSNLFNKHKECLSALLYLDTWRGKDSTGVAAVRHNADTEVLKSTVPGYEFVEGPKLDQHLKLNDFCWIGHNRFGTVGKNIKTNAHPFMIDDEDGGCLIVGAHNGTLRNKHHLTDHAKFGTDSEALFNEIAVNGVEKAIEKIEGAWALTYYDHIEEELRIIRNKERTLFYAYEEGKKTLIWASEMWMIRVACMKAGIKLQDDKIVAFTEDTLYKFPAPEKMNEDLTCTRQGGLVGKQAAGFFHGGRTGWTGGTDWRGNHQSRTQTTQTPTEQRTERPTPGSAILASPSSSSQTENPSSKESSQTSTTSTSSTPSGTPIRSSGGTQTKSNESSSNTPSKDKSDESLHAQDADESNVISLDKAKSYKGYGGRFLSKKELEAQLENGCGWCESEFILPTDTFGWLAPGKPVCVKCLEGGHDLIPTPSKQSLH